MRSDNTTQSRERLIAKLEEMRKTLPADQYAVASARIMHQLKKLSNRQRYAVT